MAGGHEATLANAVLSGENLRLISALIVSISSRVSSMGERSSTSSKVINMNKTVFKLYRDLLCRSRKVGPFSALFSRLADCKGNIVKASIINLARLAN